MPHPNEDLIHGTPGGEPVAVTTLDAVEAILREDLPKDTELSRRSSEERDYLGVSIWARRYNTYPLRFEMCILGAQVVLHRIKHPNTVTGPSFCFELADPNVWKQMFDFFAKECVL